jgi:hypothetical protein
MKILFYIWRQSVVTNRSLNNFMTKILKTHKLCVRIKYRKSSVMFVDFKFYKFIIAFEILIQLNPFITN